MIKELIEKLDAELVIHQAENHIPSRLHEGLYDRAFRIKFEDRTDKEHPHVCVKANMSRVVVVLKDFNEAEGTFVVEFHRSQTMYLCTYRDARTLGGYNPPKVVTYSVSEYELLAKEIFFFTWENRLKEK